MSFTKCLAKKAKQKLINNDATTVHRYTYIEDGDILWRYSVD